MENAGMYKELVENSDNIVIVTDPEFNIRYVSSAVEKTFELKPGNLIGKSVFDFVNPDRIQQWKECLEEQQESFTEEISLTTAHGKKSYFDIHVKNLVNRFDVQGVALQLHNITDKKKKERALKKANEQLDQMIYKTTHDLKAPVISALSLIDLAEKATADEKDHYIELVKKSLTKLDSFIEEMNDFFRNEKLALQREQIHIEQLLREEIDNLKNFSLNYGVKISVHRTGDVDFYSDKIRLKTILTNVLSNAIKYSDLKKSEPFIRIFVSINEDFCELRVVDNGIGIDPRHQERIFDLFFRATDQSQGTGLGLFIVKDTIQKLKGTIEVVSTLGEGTTFLIRIPNQIYQPIVVD